MSKIHNWLKYYRASLIDGSRGEKNTIVPPPLKRDKSKLQAIFTNEIEAIWDKQKVFELNFGPFKKPDTINDDYEDYNFDLENAKPKEEQGNDKLTEINKIEIAPLYITTGVEHGYSIGDTKLHYPFWIPAYVDINGKLYPPKDGEIPIFIRNYINPNPRDLPAIAEMEVLDKKLINRDFDTGNWDEYWKDCESFFKEVTNKYFSDFQDGNNNSFSICQYGESNTTRNILRLYNELIFDEEAKKLKYPILEKVLEEKTEPKNHQLTTVEVLLNNNHYGQMSNDFPLSSSQRRSFAQFTSKYNDNIFAINGPPGTGKTTMLQSVIANSLVQGVLNQKPTPLIIGCSTNNQAITNILDSMQLQESNHLLSQRWLPDVSSFGLYLAAASKGKEASKDYQLATNSYLNDGFIESLDDQARIDEYHSFFSEKYINCFTDESFDENTHSGRFELKCKPYLLKKIKNLKIRIDEVFKIGLKRYEVNAILQKKGFVDFDALKTKIKNKESEIEKNEVGQSLLNSIRTQLSERNKAIPFYIKIFPFKRFRAVRENAFKLILHPIIDELSSELKLYKYYQIISEIENLLFRTIKEKQQLQNLLSDLESVKNNIAIRIQNYQLFLDDWYKHYVKQWENLIQNTGSEYRNLEVLQNIATKLDISYRYELFWLCVHFREWEYIQELKESDSGSKSERGKISYETKLRRLAKVTPLFISTFHSLPKFSNYWSHGKGEKFYKDLFDLIIVDESGQVSPEVAIPSLTFAKKILAVGDIYQIEPVWGVAKGVDYTNAAKYNVVNNEENFEYVNELGFTASNGSIMKMIRKATPFSFKHKNGEEEKGSYLLEHRRCLNPIVEFSAKYVYKGSLQLMVGNKHSKPHNLPPLGYVHINGSSEKHKGSSRKNIKEANAVIQWILLHKEELETAYNKALNEVIAIVTPFSAQKSILKQLLNKHFDKTIAENLVAGTVHSLQGAERSIILFSAVHDTQDKTLFFDYQGKYNMLNVALTRAKHSFIVFGNMTVFNSHKNSPSGNLAKLLFSKVEYVLDDTFLYQSKIVYPSVNGYKVDRINTLEGHRNCLKKVFSVVEKELVVFSPFISINAIEKDEIITHIKQAIGRNAKVNIITDSTYDYKQGKLAQNSEMGRTAIKKAGANLLVQNIHNKTICVDDKILIEGSFNWLSATRDGDSSYHKKNASVIIQGVKVKEDIEQIKRAFKV